MKNFLEFIFQKGGGELLSFGKWHAPHKFIRGKGNQIGL